jgi:hypothetical protein
VLAADPVLLIAQKTVMVLGTTALATLALLAQDLVCTLEVYHLSCKKTVKAVLFSLDHMMCPFCQAVMYWGKWECGAWAGDSVMHKVGGLLHQLV